jgi:uncharacterized protein YlxP (DUF503 family)
LASIIGLVEWELEVFGCHSLKDKRRGVKSLKDRLRNRFNVSVAETGHLDLWQRAEISVCAISSDRAIVESTLQSADALVANEARARVIRSTRTFV